MLTASIVCPHCNKTDLATFAELVEFGPRAVLSEADAQAVIEFEQRVTRENSHVHAAPKGQRTRRVADDMLPIAGILICQKCYHPILALFEATRVDLINHTKELRKIGTGSRANSRFNMDELRLFPEPKSLLAHPSWPERVQRLVPDIDRMIQQGFDPSIPISTSRTVIDLCTKDLGGEGKSIFDRINNLLTKGVITKPIADWAHKVRLLGRDATHDADGTDEEVADLVNFIHFFLRAAYELSDDIAKGIADGDAQETPESK